MIDRDFKVAAEMCGAPGVQAGVTAPAGLYLAEHPP